MQQFAQGWVVTNLVHQPSRLPRLISLPQSQP
jgi:hypothetical protein